MSEHRPMTSRANYLLIITLLCLTWNSTSFSFPSNYADSCGVRTSYFIARLYGMRLRLSKIAQLVDLAQDGTSSFAGIHNGLTSLGLNPSGRRLEWRDLHRLRYPTILHLQMDWGPHFMILGAISEDGVTLIDPPGTQYMSRKEFSNRWDGAALIVPPPASPVEMQLPSGQAGPLFCAKPFKDLGEFVLPLVEVPRARFIVKNTSSKSAVIRKLVASCGCTETVVSKTTVPPNADTEILCSVSNPGNAVGPQTYSVTVLVEGSKSKPLKLQFKVRFNPIVSVRPLRLYFGRVLRAKLPSSMKVQVLKGAADIMPKITQLVPSVPWISAQAKTNSVQVSILPQAPLGRLNANLKICTNMGAVNLPIAGDCIGGFTCIPNPLISYKPTEDKLPFKIIKTQHSTCDIQHLILKYDNSKISIVPQGMNHDNSEQKYLLRLPNSSRAARSYHVDISDPNSAESVTLSILTLVR